MDAGGGAHANLNGNVPPPFLSKTYDMVDDPSTDEIVSWSPGNNSFIVWNPPEIAKELLPKYFKHNNFSSFVRQLNTYGFRKIDPDRWEFANEGFLRGQKHLLKGIQRRKPNHTHAVQQMPQGQRATAGRCVEVGKFGLEEEVERLKRDKNVLMQELVRLRQQQQTTDNQLQTVLQRFQGMEQRQQQMMSFLAKAVQSPSFLAQFMQPNDAKQRVAGVSKKRRLPKQEDVSVAVNPQSEGQIIKYQPIMNDAAKALFMQMLGMESAAALQPTINGPESPDSFFVGASPSAPADQDSSSSLASCVTFAEMNPHSGIPSHPTPCFQDVTSIPKNNSPISGIPLNLTGNGIHGMQDSSNPCEAVLDIPELSDLTGMIPENGGLDIANLAYPSPKLENGSFDSLSVDGADGAVPLDLDSFSAEADGALMFDETSPLPDIDGFWDHLFTASPHSSEIEDLESTSHGSRRNENGSGVYGENRYCTAGMDQLTHQMGLLRSEQK